MSLTTHGDRKYDTSDQLSDTVEWPAMLIEHRRLKAGAQSATTTECTEIVLMLSGRSNVRRIADGHTQEVVAQPGMSWIVPAGTHETRVELGAEMECLHLYLPPTLLDRSALADYDIDPAKTELAYAGGFADPMLSQFGAAFRGLLGRTPQPTDRLFVDGMQAALAAHLVGNYTVESWQPPERNPSLDAKRLNRVLDFIEARLDTDISLEDLAAEACLSPFHFSRIFRDATGLSPHRFVTDRRVQAAKEKLAVLQSSFVEIALDTGFGSQANFIRVFRKATGLTPGQYRNLRTS